jgi:CRP-like cAMP-binding protein
MNFLELFKDWENREVFDAQSVIFSENEPADVMYVVLSGEVELSLHGEVLGTETAGGIIGEMAIINSKSRNSTATAKTDVSLARLDKGQIRELVDMSSEFSLHAMATLANRLRAVDRYISDHIGQ